MYLQFRLTHTRILHVPRSFHGLSLEGKSLEEAAVAAAASALIASTLLHARLKRQRDSLAIAHKKKKENERRGRETTRAAAAGLGAMNWSGACSRWDKGTSQRERQAA